MEIKLRSGSSETACLYENKMEKGEPVGISFKLNYGGSFAPIRIDGCFGKPQAYAVAAASAVGFAFGMNLVKISEALHHYKMPSQRGNIIPGIKKTFIIDDSYNAAPTSMKAAIELADSMKFKRKIAVLGDMLEIGKYTIQAHEDVGKLVVNVFDILITIGPRSKFIAETASKKGFPIKNIFNFEFADDAKLKIQEILKKGDLVLVKGSRALELEKVVEEIKLL